MSRDLSLPNLFSDHLVSDAEEMNRGCVRQEVGFLILALDRTLHLSRGFVIPVFAFAALTFLSLPLAINLTLTFLAVMTPRKVCMTFRYDVLHLLDLRV